MDQEKSLRDENAGTRQHVSNFYVILRVMAAYKYIWIKYGRCEFMLIEKLITRISSLPNCTVFPPSGLPKINKEHELTDEVIRFYELCGGAVLFAGAPYSVSILKPDEVTQTTPIF